MARKIVKKQKTKNAYSVIVDGQTEKWYLQLYKDYEKIAVDIKPELAPKKSLKEIFEQVMDNSKIYSKVFWILDFDVIAKEGKNRINELRGYLNEIEKKNNVELLVNTPCLEFWFLQHFGKSDKYYEKCSNIVRKFKGTVLNDYEKSEKYFKRKNNDIYSKLKPFFKNAVDNSSKLGGFKIDDCYKGKAEIYRLFEELS